METMKPSVNGSKEPKEKALSLAVAQIERQFGKGAIMRLGAEPGQSHHVCAKIFKR